MTDRKQALTDILAKVEAGDTIQANEASSLWPTTYDKDENRNRLPWLDACRASCGSLDAALAFHEAVLPGWIARPECGGSGAGVEFWGCVLEDWNTGDMHSAHNTKCPA